MLVILLIISAALFAAIGQYVDKHLVNMGISRKDYFYYMCLSMLPFAGLMIVMEIATGQFRFSFEIIPVLLLLVAMFLRYTRQKTIVGCLTYLNPYEDSAYLTLGLIIAFIVDVIIGTQTLDVVSVISILLTIVGVFMVANSKLRIKSLRIDLIVRIAASLLIGYVTYFILDYWSNAAFILVLNLLLTLIFSKDYKLSYHKKHKKIIKWVFVQQTFGFAATYLGNILISKSVTLSNYVRPMSLIIILLIALMLKGKDKRPTMKQAFGVILIVAGVFLIK